MTSLQQVGAATPAFTEEQVELIKKHYAKGAGDLELSLFFGIADRMRLDPFKGQCHYVQRGGKWTFQVGIDGYRAVAVRSGEYKGQDGPYWCGADGVWRDVWLDKEPPQAARVGVKRTGFDDYIYDVATWASYGVRSANGMYKTMPDVMLAKVAEARALRRAFPNELGGTYIHEEVAQADVPARQVKVKAGPAAAPVDVEATPVEPELSEADKMQRAAQALAVTETAEVPLDCDQQFAEAATLEQVKAVRAKWLEQARAEGWGGKLAVMALNTGKRIKAKADDKA